MTKLGTLSRRRLLQGAGIGMLHLGIPGIAMARNPGVSGPLPHGRPRTGPPVSKSGPSWICVPPLEDVKASWIECFVKSKASSEQIEVGTNISRELCGCRDLG